MTAGPSTRNHGTPLCTQRTAPKERRKTTWWERVCCGATLVAHTLTYRLTITGDTVGRGKRQPCDQGYTAMIVPSLMLRSAIQDKRCHQHAPSIVVNERRNPADDTSCIAADHTPRSETLAFVRGTASRGLPKCRQHTLETTTPITPSVPSQRQRVPPPQPSDRNTVALPTRSSCRHLVWVRSSEPVVRNATHIPEP